MKKIIPAIFLTSLAFAVSGCGGNNTATSNNSNTTNVAASTPAPSPTADAVAAAANTDSNRAGAVSEPVPTFSDEKAAIEAGNKYLDGNATEKAVEAYNQAVKINPESGEGFFRLGIAYLTLENEKEAAQVNEETPTPTPGKNKKTSKKTVEIPQTDSAKAFDKSVKAYEKYVKKNPKDDAAFFNLGRAFNKLNKDKEAEKALSQAAKLKPEDGEYQTEYGAILVKLAQYDRAIPVLKKALKIDETNSQAQELLERAESGKKRIDFGAEKAAKQIAAQKQQQQQPR